MDLLLKQNIAACLLFGALMMGGCASSPDTDKPDATDNGGEYYPSEDTEEQDVRITAWQPVIGRMNAYLQRRHIPDTATGQELLVDEFDGITPQQIPGWRVVGPVELKPIVLENQQGFQLRSPEQATRTCGIERSIETESVAGREVQVELRLTCRSTRQAKDLEGIDFFVRVRNTSGNTFSIPLPIHALQTSGWERQRWWLRFEENLASVTFSLHARRAGSRIILDSFRLKQANQRSRRLLKRPLTGQDQNEAALNAVIGGDFETGRSGFYTSALRRWPNGEKMVAPLNWEIASEGVSGQHSMRIYLDEQSGRVVFGPLDLHPLARGRYDQGIWFHLYFHARADRPCSVTVMLHTPSRIIGRATFKLTQNWQPYGQRFFMTASSFEVRSDLAKAELVFDFTNDDQRMANQCQLDGVSLTDQPLQQSYVQPSPVEVGLMGPVPDAVDLSNLVDVGESVGFGVRLIAETEKLKNLWPTEPTAVFPEGPSTRPTTAPANAQRTARVQERSAQGSLAVDVLDAWDRVVWTRTSTPDLLDQPVYNEMVRLQLPRGYYRVLASYWSGKPGASKLLSRDTLPLAVISLNDAVPLNNRFGLSLSQTNVSSRTTHLGAGWVWGELPANRVKVKPGLYDFSAWQSLVQKCQKHSVQLVVGLTLPRSKLLWKLFAEQLVTDPESLPIGIMLRPPAIAPDPAEDYFAQLIWFDHLLQEREKDGLLIRYFSPSTGIASLQELAAQDIADVVAVSCPQRPIPEMNESLLQRYGDLRLARRRVMDLRVPVKLGGASGRGVQIIQRFAGPAQRLTDRLDPLVSGSRMVRAMLIRNLAGVELTCCEAVALSPVRSLYDKSTHRLHEADMTPRPAVVAFDLMAELLNDASLLRWIDFPDGSRALYYEKDDGRAVAAIWRPYGMSMSRIAFPAFPEDFQVMDCFGLPEPLQTQGEKTIVEINEIVRYIVAPQGQKQVLRQALNEAKLNYDMAEDADR